VEIDGEQTVGEDDALLYTFRNKECPTETNGVAVNKVRLGRAHLLTT